MHSNLELPTDFALCSECLTPIPYVFTFRDNEVLMEKTCQVHGTEKINLSSDKNYWISAVEVRKKKSVAQADGPINPYMLIVEAIDECDIECPTCIASSISGGGNIRERSKLVGRVRRLGEKLGKIPLLMVSGGEPTLHPEILPILSDMGKLASQVMLITNGIRIAQDQNFVEQLASLGENFQVYLQFDSLQPSALTALRGADFRETRLQALSNLEKHGVATTLVSVIKRGINDTEVADIVHAASRYGNVRGVTFQPIRSTGRHADFRYLDHSIPLSEVRATLLREFEWPEDAMIPHPINPEGICIGYFARGSERLTPATSHIFSIDSSSSLAAGNQLYVDQKTLRSICEGKDMMRVTIISFLDRHDYTASASRRGGVYFLTDSESLVTLDNRFLFGLNAGQQALSDLTSQEICE